MYTSEACKNKARFYKSIDQSINTSYGSLRPLIYKNMFEKHVWIIRADKMQKL